MTQQDIIEELRMIKIKAYRTGVRVSVEELIERIEHDLKKDTYEHK